MLPMSFPLLDVAVLSAIFMLFGLAQFLGPRFICDAYGRADFAPSFCRVTAVLELVAGIFLAMVETRLWGLMLAAFVSFVTVVILLGHSKYLYAVPGIAALVALAPAALTLHI